MSENKGNILLLLISAVAALALVAAGFFFWQNQASEKPKAPSKVNNEINDGKTFLNYTYQYSISAPSDFKLKSLCSGYENNPEICYKLENPSRSIGIGIYYSVQGSRLTANGSPGEWTLADNLSVSMVGHNYKPEEYDQYFNNYQKHYEFHIPLVYNGTNPSQISIQGYYTSPEEAKLVSQILSTFEFLTSGSNPASVKLSNGKTVQLEFTDQSEAESSQIQITYLESLPQSMQVNSYQDSDGTNAGTGTVMEKASVSIHGFNFKKLIGYYNPIAITKSGKYDSQISSQNSESCIYTYPNNEGYVLFGPVVPSTGGTSGCEFISSLKSLTL